MKATKDYSGIAIANVERTLRTPEAIERGKIVRVEMLSLAEQLEWLDKQDAEYKELQRSRRLEQARINDFKHTRVR